MMVILSRKASSTKIRLQILPIELNLNFGPLQINQIWVMHWYHVSFIKIPTLNHSNIFLFFKNGPIPASFCLFSYFSHYNFNNTNWKSIDGVLGIRTHGHRMLGADKSTELWRPPIKIFLWAHNLLSIFMLWSCALFDPTPFG